MNQQRVVLARRVDTFARYRWTGNEPADLNDADIAVQLGALWEGDELVTYNLPSLAAQLEHWTDDWQTDDD